MRCHKSHTNLSRKFLHNLALPSPTKKNIYKAAWCAHNHCPSSLCRWELSCWSLGAYLGCWKDDIRPVAWMNAWWMFEDSQNLVLETFLNPAKRENFGRWNQVFWGVALEWYHLKRGKSTEDNPKSCNSSCWRPNAFQCQQTFVVFQSSSTKSSWIFLWSLETHHFGGTVDRKAPDFDRRTIGSKRAHWWRTQTPGGSSILARLGDLNCWKIRPRKQFFQTKRVNWSFIRPFPSEWNVFFCSGGVFCDS